MERGQTSFDFAVGMGIFLLSVGFVLTFIPTIFQPFAVGSGGDEIVGDRIASTLAEDALVENVSQPSVLNATRTTEFFAGGVDELEAAIGPTEENVNVTIRQSGQIVNSPIPGNTTQLSMGDPPRDGADVTLSRRVVWIAGEVYQLWVRIW